MRVSSGSIEPLMQMTPLLCASSSPRTSTTRPSVMPTMTPQPVPQNRHTDLVQVSTVCFRLTRSSRPPQVAAPAPTAAATPPSVRSTWRRLMSDVVSVARSSGSLFALIAKILRPVESLLRRIREDPRQGRLVGRLREVRVESCARRLLLVLFLAEPCQRHKQDPAAQNTTNPLTGLVSVEPSHPDVEEDRPQVGTPGASRARFRRRRRLSRLHPCPR